jgi:DNA-binding transcriptional ArsR family regulator
MAIAWERVAAAMMHPTAVAIVRVLDAEPGISPKSIAERIGKPVGVVSYHVRMLAKKRVIKLVDLQTRRGALEHFYALSSHPRPAITPQGEVVDE